MTEQTLLEFLGPVRKGTQKDICLCAMHYLAARGQGRCTAAELKASLVKARVPKAKQLNVAAVLARAGELVAAEHDGRANTWALTSSGEAYVANALGLNEAEPEVKNTTDRLSTLLGGVSDEVVKGYIEESLLCYQVNARRAAVVFLWSGAIRHMQDKALVVGTTALNAALVKHDPKAKQVAKIEDFSAVKDVTQLLAFREVGPHRQGAVANAAGGP